MATDPLLAKYGVSRNGHAIFSPSGSKRWISCNASLIKELSYPDNAGEDAAIGTVAHSMAEIWLKTGKRPSEHVGEIIVTRNGDTDFPVEVTDTMLGFVEDYIEWCTAIEGDTHTEVRVDTSFMLPIPGQGGTADYVVMGHGWLVITDLKYGTGVQVFAPENTQLIMYALGIIEEYDWIYGFTKVTLRICQPRLGHFDAWETTVGNLREWQVVISAAARAAWSDDASFNPSPESCRFCRVANCRAKETRAEQIALASFDDEFDGDDSPFRAPIRVRPFAKVSTEYLVQLVEWQGWFEKWLHQARTELERRADADGTPAGMKYVQGRGSRAWSSMIQAAALLRSHGIDDDDIYAMELVSVAEGERLLRSVRVRGKRLEETLRSVVAYTPGKPSLVPITDRRAEVADIADESFDDADDDL